MRVRVQIVAAGQPPPEGAPVVVQVLDTALQDTVSAVMAEKRLAVGRPAGGGAFAVAELDVTDPGAYPTVSVHVDVDRDGRVSAGDYITMQSYPCREDEMTVEVRKV